MSQGEGQQQRQEMPLEGRHTSADRIVGRCRGQDDAREKETQANKQGSVKGVYMAAKMNENEKETNQRRPEKEKGGELQLGVENSQFREFMVVPIGPNPNVKQGWEERKQSGE